MKTLLTSLIIAGGALLPISQIQAAPASKDISFAAKTYGDFAPGKKFTLTVTDVVSVKGTLTGTPKKSAVPGGIPKFKKGQKVKFAIGSKGELKGAGFAIKFEAGSITSNAYVNKPKKGANVQGDTGIVFKDSLAQPSAANLFFFKTSGSGLKTAVYSVNYVLD